MKVLVYGATGTQSSPLVWHLLERGHQPFVLTRHPDRAQQMRSAGAQIVSGDMADKTRLLELSQGMDAVALQIPAFSPFPELLTTFAFNAIDTAREAGVKLLVWNTSGPMVEGPSGDPVFELRNTIRDYLLSSDIPAITIQPTSYLENLLGPWTISDIAQKNVLSYPIEAERRVGWIATADVAALILAALERPELAGETFIASGPEGVTGPELAERFSRSLGRPITYYSQSPEEFGAVMSAIVGPKIGESAAYVQRSQRAHAHRMTMFTDMQPILSKLPVTLSSIETWVLRHQQAFTQS
jgi:uncharacterized protein YbjT (DUF2867 family)